MSLSGLSLEVASEPRAPKWALAPCAERAGAIDRAFRLSLADSLAYLTELAGGIDQEGLAKLAAELGAGSVSPWVFCLYSRLVAELAKDGRGNAAQSFDAIARAAELAAVAGVVAFRDPAIDGAWWDHFRVLLNTDPKRPFKPQVCGPALFALCRHEIEAAQALLRRADPAFHDEVSQLLRMIVLAAPESPDLDHLFNGASSFFLWGATFLNADLRRSSVSLIDLLVHESSHVLLFGIGAESALTRNSGEERYSSPLRSDPRPIDGIFHACFVATRVSLAMSRLLMSGVLTQEQSREAEQRRDHNGNAARISLAVLDEHARLTELGGNVLDTIRAYHERNEGAS
jgi:HEXXH motif-containing protein